MKCQYTANQCKGYIKDRKQCILRISKCNEEDEKYDQNTKRHNLDNVLVARYLVFEFTIPGDLISLRQLNGYRSPLSWASAIVLPRSLPNGKFHGNMPRVIIPENKCRTG